MKKGSVLITMGLLLLGAALFLTGYNYWDALRAREASREILVNLEQAIDGRKEKDISVSETLGDKVESMPTKMIDGYSYIGILEIPSQGLNLPVMAEWDYERLKNSPCRYTGSYLTDDLVVCAHNYPYHFDPISKIKFGEEIYFVTVTKKVYRYRMTELEVLQPTQVSEMIGKEGGKDGKDQEVNGFVRHRNSWDLTMFTCDLGGLIRYAVRCERIEGEKR